MCMVLSMVMRPLLFCTTMLVGSMMHGHTSGKARPPVTKPAVMSFSWISIHLRAFLSAPTCGGASCPKTGMSGAPGMPWSIHEMSCLSGSIVLCAQLRKAVASMSVFGGENGQTDGWSTCHRSSAPRCHRNPRAAGLSASASVKTRGFGRRSRACFHAYSPGCSARSTQSLTRCPNWTTAS